VARLIKRAVPHRGGPSAWEGRVKVAKDHGNEEVYRNLREDKAGNLFDFTPGVSAAELRAFPDWKLAYWGEVFYNNFAILEDSAFGWRKPEAISASSVMYWSKQGDWDTLANYIERGNQITPEIGSFIAGILRGEIRKPGKPTTLAKLKRDFEIVRWVRAERANGKSKATALEGAAAKFNLAYDTIDDIFDAVLAEYREHIAKEKDRLASVALAWRALRAVAEEFKRRGSDGYAWVFSDSPFEGTFGELDEHL
jgi:hypothetical protein